MFYVIASIMVVMAAVSVISTIMALLNFMWLVAGISAIMSCALLYGVDCLAEVIEGA
jgi:hypothetical protein